MRLSRNSYGVVGRERDGGCIEPGEESGEERSAGGNGDIGVGDTGAVEGQSEGLSRRGVCRGESEWWERCNRESGVGRGA